MFEKRCKNGSILYRPKLSLNSRICIDIFVSKTVIGMDIYNKNKTNTSDRSDILISYIVSNKSGILRSYQRTRHGFYETLPSTRGRRVDSAILNILRSGMGREGLGNVKSFSTLYSIRKLYGETFIGWGYDISKLNYVLSPIEYILSIGMYPLFKEIFPYPNPDCLYIPPQISPEFRHSKTLKELAYNLSRFTGKKLERTLAVSLKEKHLLGFAMKCRYLRGMVPQDYLYTTVDTPFTTFVNLKNFRNVFKRFTPKRILRMFSEDGYGYSNGINNTWILSDTIRMANGINIDIEPRNLIELHDYISSEYRKKQNQCFDLPNKTPGIDGQHINNMKIIVPKTNHELVDWGARMHNCIASYAERVKKSKGEIILGVMRGSDLIYNIEICNHEIVQFKSKYNHNPDATDEMIVMNYLRNNNIIE